MRLLALFPDRDMDPLGIDEYNRITVEEYERVRDFLILHYCATERDDTPLWNYCRTMEIPDTLRYKIDHFRRYGRIVSPGLELFQNPSWLAVYIGQQVWPERYEPIVDERAGVDAAKLLGGIRRVMEEAAGVMPTHDAYIKQHCRAPAEAPAA
jgi:tryptophan halogenase